MKGKTGHIYGWKGMMTSLLILCSLCGYAQNEGTPFHTNYSSDEYNAHERNFDVVCDKWGNVYFANFQGILHYDNSRWELLTTTDISRVTALFMTGAGDVYVGGYNATGKLVRTSAGALEYKDLGVSSSLSMIKTGEVSNIASINDTLVFVGEDNISFCVNDSIINRVKLEGITIRSSFVIGDGLYFQAEEGTIYRCFTSGKTEPYSDMYKGHGMQVYCVEPYRAGNYLIGSDQGISVFHPVTGKFVHVDNKDLSHVATVSGIITLSDSTIVLATSWGLFHLDSDLKTLSHFNEKEGLSSDVINAIASDGCGSIWCAGVQGISAVSWPSFFSSFGEKEGLTGEVLCSVRHRGILYVGTYQGLSYYDSSVSAFVKIEEIPLACWNLTVNTDGELLASTSMGLFSVSGAKCRMIYDSFCMSLVQMASGGYLSGESDGIYHVSGLSPVRKVKVADVTQADKIAEASGKYWIENAFGEIFILDPGSWELKPVSKEMGLNFIQGNKLFIYKGRGYIVGRQGLLEYNESTGTFSTSLLLDDFSYTDINWWPGLVQDVWGKYFIVTSGDDTEISIYDMKTGKTAEELTPKLFALRDLSIRYVSADDDGILWAGGSFGLVRMDLYGDDLHYDVTPKAFIRNIEVNDSTIWCGSFSDTALYRLPQLPLVPKFPSRMRNLNMDFGSLTADSYMGNEYSYILEGYDDNWSDWSESSYIEYRKLPYRKFTLRVKTRDSFERESDELAFSFSITKPFFIQWYSFVLYALILVFLFYIFLKMRTAKMVREKEKLEGIVEERTSEVRKQRDEIHEKSKELEKTLNDLGQAQNELVRQEKMAMVGKLTKGLVDRILNPINYINNFSKLTLGFTKDIKENMDEVKDHMPEDVYEDSLDIFDLMKSNLEKISSHGQSVSRILKSMEEMLRERNIVFTKLDICEQCRIILDVFEKQEEATISKYKIKLEFVSDEESIVIDAISDLLKKALNGMIVNSIYALEKKAEKEEYDPVLKITVARKDENTLTISIYDNGIGIEEKIMPELFDPYFTTKPTAEAAGIGLYLTKDVIQTHGGTIEVKSEKNVYTEFIIMLPVNHTKNDE